MATAMGHVSRKPGQTYGGSVLGNVKYEHLVAGVSGGVLATLTLHPLDLVKIRFAVNDKKANRPRYDGLVHAFRSILKTGGVPGLYQGVTPNVIGAGIAWGSYFLFYNTIKTYMQGESLQPLKADKNLLAAAEAGVLTLVITNPIWVVKTRLCLQYSSEERIYRGMLHGLVSIYRSEGAVGLYKGFVPGMLGVSHGALQFMAYEELKKLYNEYQNKPYNAKLSTTEYLMCAVISKLFAAVVTYPYQVLRARLQDHHTHYTGLIDCVKQTWRYEGLRGFYKGLCPYMLHVMPSICIVFLVYEHFSNFTNVTSSAVSNFLEKKNNAEDT